MLHCGLNSVFMSHMGYRLFPKPLSSDRVILRHWNSSVQTNNALLSFRRTMALSLPFRLSLMGYGLVIVKVTLVFFSYLSYIFHYTSYPGLPSIIHSWFKMKSSYKHSGTGSIDQIQTCTKWAQIEASYWVTVHFNLDWNKLCYTTLY